MTQFLRKYPRSPVRFLFDIPKINCTCEVIHQNNLFYGNYGRSYLVYRVQLDFNLVYPRFGTCRKASSRLFMQSNISNANTDN